MSTDDDFPDLLRARLDALAPTIEVDTSWVIAGARRRRRGTLIGSGATILLVVSGVAWAAAAVPWAGPEPADGTFVNGWLRPAWMDEQAEMQAGYIAAYQACVDAKGLDFRVGIVEETGVDPSDFGSLSTSDPEELWRGVLDCQAQMGIRTIDWAATDDSAREFYGRQLDVAECLSHLGFDLGVPPTEEDWLEDLNGLRAIGSGNVRGTWNVYGHNSRYLYSTDANLFLFSEETHEACPEPWSDAWTPDDVDPDAPPAEVWVEPAWFDEEAELGATHRDALQECIAEKGWDVVLDANGNRSSTITDIDEHARYDTDIHDCWGRLGFVDVTTSTDETLIRQQYRKQVDTWECVLHLGFDVAPPPPEEEFVQMWGTTQINPWMPYGQGQGRLYSTDTNTFIDEDPEVQVQCPLPSNLVRSPDDQG